MRIRFGIVIALARALAWSADAQQKGAGREPFRIGPEDTLRISVWKNDAMSGPAWVRPDGIISLPLLDDVQAEGLTPLELRAVLTGKRKEFIPNPEVSVIVTDIRSLRVSVMGEVARPGRFELKSWVDGTGGSRHGRRVHAIPRRARRSSSCATRCAMRRISTKREAKY